MDDLPNVKNRLLNPGRTFHSAQPVHPQPDFSSYIPEEHYEPITQKSLEILEYDGLDAFDEIKKYYEKKSKKVHELWLTY